MEKLQNTQKSLLRRIAVATGAGLLAVVTGFGMAPAGADDDVKVEAEVEANVNPMKGGFRVMDISEPVGAADKVKVGAGVGADIGEEYITSDVWVDFSAKGLDIFILDDPEVKGVGAKAEQVVFVGHSGGSHG